MIVACPVCCRQVQVTDKGQVRYHSDTISKPCPMGGRHLHPSTCTSDH